MSKQPSGKDRTDEKSEKSSKNTALILIADTANVTWRMFVPTVGLLLLGVYIDGKFDTQPIAILVGAALGFVFAIWLVIKQVKDIS